MGVPSKNRLRIPNPPLCLPRVACYRHVLQTSLRGVPVAVAPVGNLSNWCMALLSCLYPPSSWSQLFRLLKVWLYTVSGLKNDMVVESHCRDSSLINKILRPNKQFKGHYRCQWKFGQANLRDKQEIKWDWHRYPKVRATTCLHHQTAHVLFMSFYHRLSIHPPETWNLKK